MWANFNFFTIVIEYAVQILNACLVFSFYICPKILNRTKKNTPVTSLNFENVYSLCSIISYASGNLSKLFCNGACNNQSALSNQSNASKQL